MGKRALTNPSFWIALVLLIANGLAWAYALAPEGAVVAVEPRLEPDLADLRQRLIEGSYSGQPFRIEITDQEAAEAIAWYLNRHPIIPFRDPQVFIEPDGISAKGVAEIAGLRVGLSGKAYVELLDGVPMVRLRNLDVGGLAVPGVVQNRIQAEIDAQFSLAQDLPLIIEGLVLEEGVAMTWGTIR